MSIVIPYMYSMKGVYRFLVVPEVAVGAFLNQRPTQDIARSEQSWKELSICVAGGTKISKYEV
jgi:hypothetical protein